MKNTILFLALLFAASCFQSCEKETLMPEPICDSAVEILDFRVNFDTLPEMATSNDLVLLQDRRATFRLDYKLFDEGQILEHQLYLLVNDDPALKSWVFRPTELRLSESSISYTADNLERLTLDNMEFYNTQEGDFLHFYLMIEDDSFQKVERQFVIELQ